MFRTNRRFLKLLLILLPVILLGNSCLFDKEIKQDSRLNYFRAQIHVILDSISRPEQRIVAFDTLIGQVENDKDIFSQRKRNLLLTEVYYSIGNEYYILGDYIKAVQILSKPVIMNPANAVAYYNRGCAYQSADSLECAEKDYSKAISLRDNYPDAYYNRGLVYECGNQYEKALTDFKKVVSLNPTYKIDAILKLGTLYTSMDKYDNANAYYTKAISMDTLNWDGYLLKAELYKKKKAMDSAMLQYNTILTKDSFNVYTLQKRAELYNLMGDIRNADADLQQVEQINTEINKKMKNSSMKNFNKIKKHDSE